MASVFRFAALCFAFVGVLIYLSYFFSGHQATGFSDYILPFLIIYISIALYFVFRRQHWSINRIEGFVLLVILWCVLPLPIAIAFMQGGAFSFVDAYFEASSALTTTGASVIVSLEDTPGYVLTLRGITQWLGGLLTLIGVVVIMAPAGLGGLPSTHNRYTKGDTSINPYLARPVVIDIISAYIILSLACFITLSAFDVPSFDAFHLMTAAVATGGMVGSDTPIGTYGGGAASYVLAFFMMIAGTSVLWQRQIIQRRLSELTSHRETYFYIVSILLLGFVFAATFFQRAGSREVLSPEAAFMEGFFTAASLVSTSGLEIRNSSFSVLPATFVMVVVLIGGCALSTAGGISFYRIGAMISHSLKDFATLVYPNSVQRSRFGSSRYGTSQIMAIWSYFFAVMVIVLMGAIFLALRLERFDAALIASVAAFSNIGGFYSTGWSETGQWTAFHNMDNETKIVLCVIMILGRLHILVLLTAFNRVYWSRAKWSQF